MRSLQRASRCDYVHLRHQTPQSARRKNREGGKKLETQQFFPLPIATYMAQMVFVKTSEYFWSNQKVSQTFWMKSKRVQLTQTETAKACKWKSPLTAAQSSQRLWPLSKPDTSPPHVGENDRSPVRKYLCNWGRRNGKWTKEQKLWNNYTAER